MSSQGANSIPKLPTLPQGEPVASYPTYELAQKAVDHLSDRAFPVQNVTIVGTDLRSVERVTGRLTYSRVALAGLASGAYFGLFVGLLLSMFSNNFDAMIIGTAIGAGFGLLFSIVPYAFTRGKRDFTSATQIVAGSYTILAEASVAPKAAQILAAAGLSGRPVPAAAAPGAGYGASAVAPAAQQPQAPAAQSVSSQFVDSTGRPRYGLRIEDLPGQQGGAAPVQPSPAPGQQAPVLPPTQPVQQAPVQPVQGETPGQSGQPQAGADPYAPPRDKP